MDSYRFQKYFCESDLNDLGQNSNKKIRFLEMCQKKDFSTPHRTFDFHIMYYFSIHLYGNILVSDYIQSFLY